jgi:hypothetical protein
MMAGQLHHSKPLAHCENILRKLATTSHLITEVLVVNSALQTYVAPHRSVTGTEKAMLR